MAPGSALVTFSVTAPRPPGTDFQTSLAPCSGHLASTRSTRPKPSTKVGQRLTSVQRSYASCGESGTTVVARALAAVDLADDHVDRARHRVEERPHVVNEALVLLPPRVGERVVAAAAALGVLPSALDQLALLELAQQRIHRVRVDAEDAGRDRADPVHQLVAVARSVGDEVEDEQRQHLALAQLPRERIALATARARRPRRLDRARRLARLRDLRGLRDGLSSGLPAGCSGWGGAARLAGLRHARAILTGLGACVSAAAGGEWFPPNGGLASDANAR